MQIVLRYFRIAVYPLVICFIVSQAPKTALAQEQLTVTSFYPTPLGIYDKVSVSGSYGSLEIKDGFQLCAGPDLAVPCEPGGTMTPMISFFPADFPQGIVFRKHVTFRGHAGFNDNVTVTGNFISRGQISAYKIEADNTIHSELEGEITGWPGEIIAGIITGTEYIAGRRVIDTVRGRNIGASIEQRYLEDIDIQGVNAWQTTAIAAIAAAMTLYETTGLSPATIVAIIAADVLVAAGEAAQIWAMTHINPNVYGAN